MKFVARLLWTSLLFVLMYSCTPKGQEGVSVEASGVLAPVLYRVDGKDGANSSIDLGEFVLSSPEKPIDILITNNTKYPYKNLKLEITPQVAGESMALGFVPNLEGEIAFPGLGGTCTELLRPQTSCTVKLLLAPRENRRYNDKIVLSFDNIIQPESYQTLTTILAGELGTLVFTNDKTQYVFGQLIGTTNPVPVVERAETSTYQEELEIVNAGGLSVRDLNSVLNEECRSQLTRNCPTGMGNVYTLDHNCPSRMEPGQKCRAVISYLPKNQDPLFGATPADIEEIKYNATPSFRYISGPLNQASSLNGFFRSISSTIEARFKMAVESVIFDTPIVSGNRESRTIRINNVGYREGEMRSFIFRDHLNNVVAECVGQGTLYLNCRNQAGEATTLETFPFVVKDRNQCMRGSSAEPKMVDVGSGCLFDIIFQPSVNFLTNRDFNNWSGELVFDSRWRGNEVIKKVSLFSLSASSLAAARLELINITYNGVSYPLAANTADFGRITLQSPNFFKRRNLQFVFKNVGSVAASELSFKDGQSRVIPLTPGSINLGQHAPYYYFTSVSANSSTCTNVAPDSTCTITAQFAPIGLDSNQQEDENMFDGVDLMLKKYKSFHVSYNSGALYTDTNLTTETPDYALQEVQARLQASLVRKGLLMNLDEDPRNKATLTQLVAGDKAVVKLYLRNIGTGPIPYIKLTNDTHRGYTFVATSDPQSVGAQHDCLNLVDRPNSSSQYLGPDHGFPVLPKEESCVFSLELKTSNSYLRVDPFNETSAALINLQEMARIFTRDLLGTDDGVGLWEYAKTGTFGESIRWTTGWEYYDGDDSVPMPYPANYRAGKGLLANVPAYSHRATPQTPAKLVPSSPQPWHSAGIYRRGYTLPNVDGLVPAEVSKSKLIKPLWLYGSNLRFPGPSLVNPYEDALNTSILVQGNRSLQFAETLSAWTHKDNYDYIFYAGSFPRNSGIIDIPLNLANTSSGGNNRSAKLVGFEVNPISAQLSILAIPATGVNVANDAVLPNVIMRFNPGQAGEHQMEVTYRYQSGRCLDDLVYLPEKTTPETCDNPQVHEVKLLVLAHVPEDDTYPKLVATLQDYEVTQNATGAPTVTELDAPTNLPLTWNQASPTAQFVMDTLKLSSAATANDIYALKKITLTNNGGRNISKLNLLLRDSASSSAAAIIPSTLTFAGGTTCTEGLALAAGASCDIILKYQPSSSDSQKDLLILTLGYDLGEGQYAMQNLGFSLMPRSPAMLAPFQLTMSGSQTITPVNISINSVPQGAGVTRSSFPLGVGANQKIENTTFTYNFHGTGSSGFRRVELRNIQSTKASLLKSYQNYMGSTDTSLIPGGYESCAGQPCVTIFNNGRVVIKASKGCLFGADESNNAIPAHRKGFNNATPSAFACYIYPSLTVGVNDIMLNLLGSNADTMRENSARLEYFTVNRGSTADLYFHFSGNFVPPSSTGSGSYNNISAIDSANIRFNLPNVTAEAPGLGNIVGFRVLRTTSDSPINGTGVYNKTNTSYVDIPFVAGATHVAEFTQGLSNGTLYYFKVLAIRYNPSFTNQSRFLNLAPGQFLSAVDSGNFGTHPLRVLVPPTGMHYFHAQRRLVEHSLTGGVLFDNYTKSSDRCTTKSLLILKIPNNQAVGYKLIDSALWSLVKATPAATSYANMLEVPHWLSNAPASIDAAFSSLPTFTPGTSSQTFEANKMFYLRDGSNPSANVNLVVGGIPGTGHSDFTSYVSGVTPFASARCMLELGTNIYGSGNPW